MSPPSLPATSVAQCSARCVGATPVCASAYQRESEGRSKYIFRVRVRVRVRVS